MPEAPPGIDAPAVSAWFREQLPELAQPLAFSLLAGGRSNLTYLVEAADGAVCVLRRPPLGHVLPTAHDMAREHRVLAALADTGVPVARPLGLCADDAVNGMPFYVMEHRPGVVIEARRPEGYAEKPAERRAIGEAVVDVLATLHAVDPAAVGLEDFGRPEGYLARQVRRWTQQWERSKTDEAPAVEEVLRRLGAAVPESPAPTIVHGDYRLGNLALDPDDPGRVVAVFDWEMATLGDPLADLGYLLMSWGEPGESAEAKQVGGFRGATAEPGFPTRAELIERYAKQSGRDVGAVDYYVILAFTKLAVISEGIWARHLQGKTLGEGFDEMGRGSVPLAEHALALARRSDLPGLRD